jgi:uncharacterized protein YkwD
MVAACVPPAPRDRGRESPAAAPGEPLPQDVASAIVKLTNVERARAGVAPLRPDARLMRAAQLHADQVARARRLEHVLPGTRYPDPKDRLAAVGYVWEAYAENVAFGDSTASRVVANWMRSAGHRANIVNPAYSETGTGYAVDTRGRPYHVQVFARRRLRP